MKPEKHVLSKSTFIRGKQCLKSLYLYKNHYQLKDPLTPEQEAIFKRGTNVGELAQQLFPGGVDVSPPSPFKYQESVQKTQEQIAAGQEIIYEAAFQFDRVMVALDILVKKEGHWYAYEVKSSTKVSAVYEWDAAVQYFVITSSGIDLKDFSILYINNQYIREDALDIQSLFKGVSLKEQAEQRKEEVASLIREEKQMLAEGAMPEIAIGEHCHSPYPCDYRGYCWKQVPENSVFDLSGLNKEEQFDLYRKGVQKITDIQDATAYKKNLQVQINTFQQQNVHVEKEPIQEYLKAYTYPLYFMDFETFMPAVPLYKGNKPYEHLPFQYSVHIQETAGGDLLHKEFLAESGTDPRKAFVEQLLQDMGEQGSIVVYNATFEATVLKSLKRLFPELEKPIDGLLARIVDLMQPFQKYWFYHPKMKGSYSIKNVLPALVPELSYDDLSIGNGASAMSAYENLAKETDMFKVLETKEALLEYCKLDTLAMVKLLEALQKAVD